MNKVFATLFLVMVLAFGLMTNTKAEQPKATSIQAEGFTISIPEFRDQDFKNYDCYGCPGDPSMEQDDQGLTVPDRVKAQKKAYNDAHAAYQDSWDAKDVQAASENAFKTSDAAWPWNNLALHLIKAPGAIDFTLVSKYLKVARAVLASNPDAPGNSDVEAKLDKNEAFVANQAKAPQVKHHRKKKPMIHEDAK